MAIGLSEFSTNHIHSNSLVDRFANDARSSDIEDDTNAISADAAAMAVDRAAFSSDVSEIEANNSEIGSDIAEIARDTIKIAASTTEIGTNRTETPTHHTTIHCNILSISDLRLVSVLASPGKAGCSAVSEAGILKGHSSGEIA